MIQPPELQIERPMTVGNGVLSTTTRVWQILSAAECGDLATVELLVAECPELIYAQYNYAPPIHYAVREGHIELVKFLLEHGGHDPDYRTYPFLDSLQNLANDRDLPEIEYLLDQYCENPPSNHYRGDNGKIEYNRSDLENEFQAAVSSDDLQTAEKILKSKPEFAKNNTFFWSEGVLLFAVKTNSREMIDLLLKYGAVFPDTLKWTQAYYFERFDGAEYAMAKGMNPNTMSVHRVTILHNMAQKGFIDKASLLLKYGAQIDAVDDEYRSTPLGMAVRWRQIEMVKFLLENGADIGKSSANWSTPLAWARKKGHNEIAEILLKSGARD